MRDGGWPQRRGNWGAQASHAGPPRGSRKNPPSGSQARPKASEPSCGEIGGCPTPHQAPTDATVRLNLDQAFAEPPAIPILTVEARPIQNVVFEERTSFRSY